MLPMEQVIQAAKEKKVGITLMKTKPVGTYSILKSRIEQLEKEGKEIDPLYRDGLPRYKDIADRAEGCGNCLGFCERACLYGVPIQGMLVLAHDQLTLA
jgi:hypothetical protein